MWTPCAQAQALALLGLPDRVLLDQSRPAQQSDLGFPIHYSSNLHEELSLDLLYAATYVFVIPSRKDNLSNTGLRGSPLQQTRGGLRQRRLVDIVDHHIAGALAQPFDPRLLAAAII